jgi:hypothetical protein
MPKHRGDEISWASVSPSQKVVWRPLETIWRRLGVHSRPMSAMAGKADANWAGKGEKHVGSSWWWWPREAWGAGGSGRANTRAMDRQCALAEGGAERQVTQIWEKQIWEGGAMRERGSYTAVSHVPPVPLLCGRWLPCLCLVEGGRWRGGLLACWAGIEFLGLMGWNGAFVPSWELILVST